MRLARLGRVCDVELSAQMAAPGGGGTEPARYWRLAIRPVNRAGAPIEVFALSAVDAVEEALLRADALGWPDSLPLPAEEPDRDHGGGAVNAPPTPEPAF